MSVNFNITGNSLELLDYLEHYWTRKKGLVIVVMMELLLLKLFWTQNGFQSIVAGSLVALGLVLVTVIIWLITSKRVLFRSGWLAALWFVLAMGDAACFYYLIYPQLIHGTISDLPFARIWGAFLSFVVIIVLGFVVDCCIVRGKKLMIVFAVNNESVVVEKTIRASIDPVVQNIRDNDHNIKLIVLPFGVIKSIRKSEKYIRFPLTRADAIIFASVIDDSDSKPPTYQFTGFSSLINERRFIKEETKGNLHKAILDVHLRFREWNYLNLAADNCSRKLAVSKNLGDMLRMYIGCIYLMKHDFKAAVPYANNAIYNAPRNDPSYGIASALFSYALLSSARELENEERDYDAALEQLNRLNKAMPVTNNDPGYNKAMARVMFYKGEIKKSETYTKKFKDLPGHRWGYELNMGFYAINKKKVLEFVQHYKNLRKYYPGEKGEIEFAIRFLEHQDRITKDHDYQILLRIAVAYLTLYLKPEKAHKLIKKVVYKSENQKFNKAINDLQSYVLENNKRLEICPKKR